MATSNCASVMRRTHSSRSCVRFCRRWATSSRSIAAVESEEALVPLMEFITPFSLLGIFKPLLVKKRRRSRSFGLVGVGDSYPLFPSVRYYQVFENPPQYDLSRRQKFNLVIPTEILRLPN